QSRLKHGRGGQQQEATGNGARFKGRQTLEVHGRPFGREIVVAAIIGLRVVSVSNRIGSALVTEVHRQLAKSRWWATLVSGSLGHACAQIGWRVRFGS